MTPNRGRAWRARHVRRITVAVTARATLPHADFNDKATARKLDKVKVVGHTNSTVRNPT